MNTVNIFKTAGMLLLLFTVGFPCFSQEFEVPRNYKLQTAKDYDLYEKDIIKCVEWLMNTPLNEQQQKRKEANAFMVQWISGSSKVHIEIKPQIVTFLDNAELLAIFMGAWTKKSLESNDFNDKILGTTAGLDAVMDFYTKNTGVIARNKGVEKYLKMKEKGTLKDHIAKHA